MGQSDVPVEKRDRKISSSQKFKRVSPLSKEGVFPIMKCKVASRFPFPHPRRRRKGPGEYLPPAFALFL